MPSRFCLPLLLTVAWLAGCAVAPPPEKELPGWEEVLELPPDQAWARTQEWPEAQRATRQFELIAHWAEQKLWDAISERLPDVKRSALEPRQQARLQIIHAQTLLQSGEELAALNALADLPDNHAVLSLRAQVYEQLRDPENALRVRFQIVALPGNASVRDAQYRQAWGRLFSVSRAELETWKSRTGDDVWRGWLDLALLSRTDGPAVLSPQAALRAWENRHPRHPAYKWLQEISAALRQVQQIDLKQLAVLIPVSGKLAPVGQAIRAGIEAGMRLKGDNPPDVRIYDTGDAATTPGELYKLALQEGAERVIGPFQKDTLARLTRSSALPVPTISLNYLDARRVDAPENLYQFGLLPEDEAAQAATRALQEGYRSAVVFAPANQWGRRLDEAFTKSFEAGGGVVRDHGFYFADASDHAAKIKDILKLSEGEHRKRELEEVLGREVISRPTRRQDIDMMFLASSPRNARLFKPQLDFYYAGDLPLYATSHIYTGIPSPLQNQDLEGVMFCDVPIVLDEGLRGKLGNVTVARQLPRFAALGADAYLLAISLGYLEAYPSASLPGLTGELSLREERRVFRTLGWARFEGGEAKPMPKLGTPTKPGSQKPIAPRYRTQQNTR